MSVTEVTLDHAGPHERSEVVTPTAEDLDRLLATLCERRTGTFYVVCPDVYLVVGVAAGAWLAHIHGSDSLWLSNPRRGRRKPVSFNFGNTPTEIAARYTCSERDAVGAARAFFADPASLPPGDWVSEWAPQVGADAEPGAAADTGGVAGYHDFTAQPRPRCR